MRGLAVVAVVFAGAFVLAGQGDATFEEFQTVGANRASEGSALDPMVIAPGVFAGTRSESAPEYDLQEVTEAMAMFAQPARPNFLGRGALGTPLAFVGDMGRCIASGLTEEECSAKFDMANKFIENTVFDEELVNEIENLLPNVNNCTGCTVTFLAKSGGNTVQGSANGAAQVIVVGGKGNLVDVGNAGSIFGPSSFQVIGQGNKIVQGNSNSGMVFNVNGDRNTIQGITFTWTTGIDITGNDNTVTENTAWIDGSDIDIVGNNNDVTINTSTCCGGPIGSGHVVNINGDNQSVVV